NNSASHCWLKNDCSIFRSKKVKNTLNHFYYKYIVSNRAIHHIFARLKFDNKKQQHAK
ncbi:MAG: hypothetical protein ACJAYD_000419, partial [Patiriisocius sp.]